MGRVRPVFIKKISKELVSKYAGVFTDNFDTNKQLINQYLILQSKLVRNRIAGYVTHLVQCEKNEEDNVEDL
jgi:small subunit ribosomal protein S17e